MSEEREDSQENTPASPEVVERLVAAHREFLAFLEARLPNRATAEEVLQTAFARTLEKGGAIRDAESAVAWFYRLLRNALVDHYRRKGAEGRALEQHAQEPLPESEQLQAAICSCMKALMPNLKREYAEVLQRADLQEVPISQVAQELAISPNNATVRLHRARQALKRELERCCGTCAAHGCLDCTCSDAPRDHGAPLSARH